MTYHVVITDIAMKKLKKMDRPTAAMILGYIEKNLEGCADPRALGKPLTANHRGKWRYRFGDYRIPAMIEEEKIIIAIVDIGHRCDIYDR